MRLFTGIDLPEDVRGNVENLLAHLRPAAHLKWTPSYNLHITLKFIGEWPNERIEELTGGLRALPDREAISIALRDLGWRPNARSPRILWLGVRNSSGLTELVSEIDARLAKLGVPSEGRAYSPHMTLARIRQPAPLGPLQEAIARLPAVDLGEFTADRFHLYRSERGAAGSIYTKLSDFPFAKE